MLSAFQTPGPPPIESVLTGLINEIAAIQEQFVLVNDHLNKDLPQKALGSIMDNRIPEKSHSEIPIRMPPFLQQQTFRLGSKAEWNDTQKPLSAQAGGGFCVLV